MYLYMCIHIYVCIYIYIIYTYIHMYVYNIMDFRGSDSNIILILRGGISRPKRGFPGKFESSNLSTVGIMLVIIY